MTSLYQLMSMSDQRGPINNYLGPATCQFRLANYQFDPFVVDQLMTNLNLLLTLLDLLMTSSD